MNLGQAVRPFTMLIDPERVRQGDVAPPDHIPETTTIRVHEQPMKPPVGTPLHVRAQMKQRGAKWGRP